MADEPVRVVLGRPDGWQQPSAGARFRTGADGTHTFQLTTSHDQRRRKRPTNFWSELVAHPQRTDHLDIAVELKYAGRPWLYTTGVDRFETGTCAQLDGVGVLAQGPDGRFTLAAKRRADHWIMPDVAGLALSAPGHAPLEVSLHPDGDEASRWVLRLTYARMPVPVIR